MTVLVLSVFLRILSLKNEYRSGCANWISFIVVLHMCHLRVISCCYGQQLSCGYRLMIQYALNVVSCEVGTLEYKRGTIKQTGNVTDSNKESTAGHRRGQSHPHMTIISDACYLHVIAEENIDVIPIYLLSQPVRADPGQECVHKPCSAQSKN